MSLYMTQFAYTPEAWAALARNPQNRAEDFGALVREMGGRFIAQYYALGEYDGVLLYEAPGEVAAEAVMLSAVSAGHLRTFKTTPLLTVDEAMEAMRKAGREVYAAPVGYAAYSS
jgi:uncharacterized protein with GYD domain